MNQKALQKATSPVERNFYKLLNNVNFGIDYRNNIDNCRLKPIWDGIGEVSYIKKFDTIFNNEKYWDFYSPQVMRDEIDQKYNNLILSLDKNDPIMRLAKGGTRL